MDSSSSTNRHLGARLVFPQTTVRNEKEPRWRLFELGSIFQSRFFKFTAWTDANEWSGNGRCDAFRRLLSGLWDDLRRLDHRVSELDVEIESIARAHPVAQRLQQLNGVGPVISCYMLPPIGGCPPLRRLQSLHSARQVEWLVRPN